MPTTHQSSTNCEGANTSEHRNTKKSRLKTYKSKEQRKRKKNTVKKIKKVTCIFICCCHLKPEENGGSP